MKNNKPSLWIFAAGAFALLAMAAYLFFALTLADHWESTTVPAGKAEATQSPM